MLLYATAIGSCESGQTHTNCLLLLSERKASVLSANPSSCGIGCLVVSASREEEDRRALTDEEEEEEEEDGVRFDQRESCCARAQGALFSACRNQFWRLLRHRPLRLSRNLRYPPLCYLPSSSSFFRSLSSCALCFFFLLCFLIRVFFVAVFAAWFSSTFSLSSWRESLCLLRSNALLQHLWRILVPVLQSLCLETWKGATKCVNKILDSKIPPIHHVRDITDPEHPYSLEQLNVVTEDSIFVDDSKSYVK